MHYLVLSLLLIAAPVMAQTAGVVVMHGKGGSPGRFIGEFASYLEGQDLLVANLEMPWSGRRGYDADVDAAVKQVEGALEGLRAKGAKKVFLAGHSQGGTFAFYAGTRLAVDGIVAIAPGGDVSTPVYRQKIGPSLEEARKLAAQGKGAEKQRFLDFEGSRGLEPVLVAPAVYVTWFDPEGAMNQQKSIRALRASMPVLLVAPTGDYLGLQRAKPFTVAALPKNALTKVIEPDATHINAPNAAREDIARWIREVAKSGESLVEVR